ncbi:MAG: hypothetical protein UT34_C0001G0494 [candidate division WS6 bacterium GW2011_GWF2_39_15]|uniref:Integral membrane protein n=1 Tax=candidate division WS6 bacterium GW2011_GWF2_39_15 TaxID=1619100 RepID=A0A0G0MTG0_9BACT|nr:MAG: hypothetical protein UT34_C0001G0494 [candidate division WS6 bacterium GW2011_GWF2_39_15]
MIQSILEKIFHAISSPVYADALSNAISGNVTEVTNAQDLPSLVNALVKLAIPLGVLSAIILFAFAGYNMITSQGDPEKLNEAREVVTNAVIGFALIALSVAILLLIRNTLNIPGLNP